MQRAGARPAVGRPHPRLPVALQRLPHRSPILRGRFHHHFHDLALDEPVGQAAQLRRAGPELPPFESPRPGDVDVGDHHRHHLLVDIDSRYPVGHRCLLAGAENVPDLADSGSQAIAAPTGDSFDAHLFAPVRTFRISQLTGFNFSTGRSISPLALPHSRAGGHDFHPFSRVDVSAWARAASTLLAS